MIARSLLHKEVRLASDILLFRKAVLWYRGNMANSAIGPAEAIIALREELLLAISTGKGVSMRLRLSLVEPALQVAATKEGSGKTGWHILGLGESCKSAMTQTLKLRPASLWRNVAGTFDSDFIVADQQDHVPGFGPHGRTNAGN
jgi:hypothetical protein